MAKAQPGKRKRKLPPEHLDRVGTMLIAMVPYAMICKQLSAEWQKSRDYVMDLIREVHADWAETSAVVGQTRKNQVRSAFETLYMKATAAKDIGGARAILVELAKLDGCYAAQEHKVALSGGVGVGLSLGNLGFRSPEEVRERIDELRGRLRAQGAAALATPTSGATALLAQVIDAPDAPEE